MAGFTKIVIFGTRDDGQTFFVEVPIEAPISVWKEQRTLETTFDLEMAWAHRESFLTCACTSEPPVECVQHRRLRKMGGAASKPTI